MLGAARVVLTDAEAETAALLRARLGVSQSNSTTKVETSAFSHLQPSRSAKRRGRPRACGAAQLGRMDGGDGGGLAG